MNPERDAIMNLADRVRRLAPSHRDPEKFHAEKSDIEHALRKLAIGQHSLKPARGLTVEGRPRQAHGSSLKFKR